MASLDIILPVFNNQRQLLATLTALAQQKFPTHHEVTILLSDDGSTDQSLTVAQHEASRLKLNLQIITSSHHGAGHARNQAIAASSADLLLLLGADIELLPDCLAVHFKFHTTHPDRHQAALGYVAWHPKLRPTPLMEWLMHGGPQNAFDNTLAHSSLDPAHYFYASHLSLKRNALAQHPFSQDFISYGWEDLELGRRLKDQGLVLRPLFKARALHNHFYSPADLSRRQRAAGLSLHVYSQLHPSTLPKPELSFLRQLKHRIFYYSGLNYLLSLLLTALPRLNYPQLFHLFANTNFWLGVAKRQD